MRRDVVLDVATAIGLAYLVVVLWMAIGGYSLVLFRTGSMSPTIPAGSVALVHRVDAHDLGVGDVATVDRPGRLPVTHRVTSIHPGAGGTEVVTMRGDANVVDDAQPYALRTARRVVWSAPGMSSLVAGLTGRTATVLLSAGLAMFVLWGWWPTATPVATES